MNVIGNKPPQVTEKVRAWKGPDSMPEDAAERTRSSIADYAGKIFNALAIKMDFGIGALGNATE